MHFELGSGNVFGFLILEDFLWFFFFFFPVVGFLVFWWIFLLLVLILCSFNQNLM